MSKFSKVLIRGLLMAGAFSVFVAIYAAVQMFLGGQSLSGAVPLLASFGCLGLLLGAIYAFDEESDVKTTGHTALRVGLSAIAGLSLALLWSWPFEALALSVLLSGMLGYLGMSWAKYLDF